MPRLVVGYSVPFWNIKYLFWLTLRLQRLRPSRNPPETRYFASIATERVRELR